MKTELIADGHMIRCPYCIVGSEFRLMIAYKDQQFVCLECSHRDRPRDMRYRCSCPHCLKLAMGLSSIALGTEFSANHLHG